MITFNPLTGQFDITGGTAGPPGPPGEGNVTAANPVDVSTFNDGSLLGIDGSGDIVEVDPASVGTTTFTGLTDAPSSYAGQAGKIVAVNDAADALEFIDAGGGGGGIGGDTGSVNNAIILADGTDGSTIKAGLDIFATQFLVGDFLQSALGIGTVPADGYVLTIQGPNMQVLYQSTEDSTIGPNFQLHGAIAGGNDWFIGTSLSGDGAGIGIGSIYFYLEGQGNKIAINPTGDAIFTFATFTVDDLSFNGTIPVPLSFTIATLPAVVEGGLIGVTDTIGSGGLCIGRGAIWIDVMTGMNVNPI